MVRTDHPADDHGKSGTRRTRRRVLLGLEWLIFLALLGYFPFLLAEAGRQSNETAATAFQALCATGFPEYLPIVASDSASDSASGPYAYVLKLVNNLDVEPVYPFSLASRNRGPEGIERFTAARRLDGVAWRSPHDGELAPAGALGDAKTLVCQLNTLVALERVYYRPEPATRALYQRQATATAGSAPVDCARFDVTLAIYDRQRRVWTAARQFAYPEDWFERVCPPALAAAPVAGVSVESLVLLDEMAREMGGWLDGVIRPRD